MWSLFVTILIFQAAGNPPIINKQEVNKIVSAEECEKAAHEWRLQGLGNNSVQVMTVCIKRSTQ